MGGKQAANVGERKRHGLEEEKEEQEQRKKESCACVCERVQHV